MKECKLLNRKTGELLMLTENLTATNVEVIL